MFYGIFKAHYEVLTHHSGKNNHQHATKVFTLNFRCYYKIHHQISHIQQTGNKQIKKKHKSKKEFPYSHLKQIQIKTDVIKMIFKHLLVI